jgi:Uma2 family endonuclease
MQAVLISPEEYLQSEFDPDADFVDGVIEERPMGEYNHSSWQAALLAWFQQHNREWNLRARPELRLKVAPTRYRIPDVAILDRNQPTEPVLSTAPLAVIEILSPEDRLKRLLVKLEDYHRMGVASVLVVDPEDGRFYRYVDGSLDVLEERVIALGSGPLHIDRTAVAELLD